MTLGGTANEAIKGLSTSPMLLLVAVINVILIGAMIYVAKSAVRRARYPDQVSDRLPEVTLRVKAGRIVAGGLDDPPLLAQSQVAIVLTRGWPADCRFSRDECSQQCPETQNLQAALPT